MEGIREEAWVVCGDVLWKSKKKKEEAFCIGIKFSVCLCGVALAASGFGVCVAGRVSCECWSSAVVPLEDEHRVLIPFLLLYRQPQTCCACLAKRMPNSRGKLAWPTGIGDLNY